jgi:hypothetical protein
VTLVEAGTMNAAGDLDPKAESAPASTSVTLVQPINGESHATPTIPLPGQVGEAQKTLDPENGGATQATPGQEATAVLPRNGKDSNADVDPEGLSSRRRERRGCLWRYWSKIEQQEIPSSSLPLRAFRRPEQCGLASCCTVLFAALSGVLLSIAGSFEEIVISYHYRDTAKVFTVDEDLKGPVLVWYEIPDLLLNHKSAVAGKDPDLWKVPFSNYQCDSASSLQDARWRRPVSHGLLAAGGTTEFRPCGLIVLASFWDTFDIFSSAGSQVAMDMTDLALEEDKKLYEDKIVKIDGKSSPPMYTSADEPSWLDGDIAVERFKVWMRTPVSPTVRQLYARIRDGLPAGQYSLNFTVNDPVYERYWDVSEKRIVLSESKSGSVGAFQVLGIVSILVACLEAIAAILFMAAPLLGARRVKTTPSTALLTETSETVAAD